VAAPILDVDEDDGELAGGLESDELSAAADPEELVVADEPPPPPHAASAPITTTVATMRQATINRSVCIIKVPQRITQRLCRNVLITLR
jgi:hypothetical protein